MRITGGEYRGRSLKTTSGPGYRPATSKVRLALFSMLEARGVSWPGARVLDLFAGSGSLGFEALSRGAALAWFVEKDKKAARLIAENAALLGIDQARWAVHGKDLFPLLAKGPGTGPFDVVFIDPPYGKNLFERALRPALDKGWIAPGGLVCAEVEAHLKLDAESVDERLALAADRSYGQTRIIAWTR